MAFLREKEAKAALAKAAGRLIFEVPDGMEAVVDEEGRATGELRPKPGGVSYVDGPRTAEPAIREFATGANRDTDLGKLDFEGFLSPQVLEAFGLYMNFNRHLSDGSLRDSDNWQKGIPIPVYRKSLIRHVFEAWRLWRKGEPDQGIQARDEVGKLLAISFNVNGLLLEILKLHPDAAKQWVQNAEELRKKGIKL